MSKLARTDLEHRLTDALSDALSDAECARLEFETRLATALADELAEIARKLASPGLYRPPMPLRPERREWWPWRRAS
jgi:hypothetical protein